MVSSQRKAWIAVSLLLVATATIGSLLLQKTKLDTDRMLNVSVSIKSIGHVSVDGLGDSVWSSQIGSGFLVTKSRCEVWTNHHVVKDAAVIEVYPRNWTGSSGIQAQVINGSEQADLAVLKMAECGDVEQATLGSISELEQGDEVYAVGNPLGKNPDSISRGIISHSERYLKDGIPYLQTDAIIGPGSSGGALFNRRGEVVGINTGIASSGSRPYSGIGYAIPVDLARQVTDQLRRGNPSWGVAGIEAYLTRLHSDEARLFGVPENLAALTLTHSPVTGPSHGRLVARDVIFGIDHQPIKGLGHAKHLISSRKPGDILKFSIVRHGQIRTVDIQLEEGWKPAPPPSPDYYRGHLGMQLEMWSESNGEGGQFKTPVITRVQSMGPAHLSRISSSQHDLIYYGGYAMRRLLDVKTVTGVVLDGDYHEVDSVEQVQTLARKAFEKGQPMLLEIEVWRRSDPQQYASPLEHFNTFFHRLDPALTRAEMPASEMEQMTREPVINTELNRFVGIKRDFLPMP